jgi:hypothetical protein
MTLLVSLPELARAQQTGLFPLAPIRRQRVPCDQQDPIYNSIKYQYYGYHPTAWRRFPTGWGYPSPERPDKEKAFRDLPLKPPSGFEGAAPGMEPLPMERGPAGRPAPPTLPREVDPFEQPGRADPFQLDRPDTPRAPNAPEAPNGPRAERSRPPISSAGERGPELSAPTEAPDPTVGNRSDRPDENEDADSRHAGGPLLAIPNVNLPPVTGSTMVFGTEPPPGPAVPTEAAADATTTPTTSSAPRRSFLGSLFSNLGLNWTRR